MPQRHICVLKLEENDALPQGVVKARNICDANWKFNGAQECFIANKRKWRIAGFVKLGSAILLYVLQQLCVDIFITIALVKWFGWYRSSQFNVELFQMAYCLSNFQSFWIPLTVSDRNINHEKMYAAIAYYTIYSSKISLHCNQIPREYFIFLIMFYGWW